MTKMTDRGAVSNEEATKKTDRGAVSNEEATKKQRRSNEEATMK